MAEPPRYRFVSPPPTRTDARVAALAEVLLAEDERSTWQNVYPEEAILLALAVLGSDVIADLIAEAKRIDVEAAYENQRQFYAEGKDYPDNSYGTEHWASYTEGALNALSDMRSNLFKRIGGKT